MEYKTCDNTIIARMHPGERFYPTLEEICVKTQPTTATVVSAVGQLTDFTLGYFAGKGDYTPETFTEPAEITSINGLISKTNGGFDFHLHGCLSLKNKHCVGGHLIAATVEVTCELVLLTHSIHVRRNIDEYTGLNTLSLG